MIELRVSSAVSKATSTSRMRDSAADSDSCETPMLAIVDCRRFCSEPNVPRSCDTTLTAASSCAIANEVLPPEPTSTVLRPSVVASAGSSDTDSTSICGEVLMPTWNATVLAEPSSSLTPLKSVECAMRSISCTRLSNSSLMVFLSAFDDEPLAAWIASSRRRTRMLLTSFSAPSPVCTSEMPSLALREAWPSERTCARRRSLIARPAASSAAVEMRRPVESRWKLRARRVVTCAVFRCALMDAMLVLTRRPMFDPLPFRCVQRRVNDAAGRADATLGNARHGHSRLERRAAISATAPPARRDSEERRVRCGAAARQHLVAVDRVLHGLFGRDQVPREQAAQRDVAGLHAESAAAVHDCGQFVVVALPQHGADRRVVDQDLHHRHAALLVRARQQRLRRDGTQRRREARARARTVLFGGQQRQLHAGADDRAGVEAGEHEAAALDRVEYGVERAAAVEVRQHDD